MPIQFMRLFFLKDIQNLKQIRVMRTGPTSLGRWRIKIFIFLFCLLYFCCQFHILNHFFLLYRSKYELQEFLKPSLRIVSSKMSFRSFDSIKSSDSSFVSDTSKKDVSLLSCTLTLLLEEIIEVVVAPRYNCCNFTLSYY